MPSQDSLPSSTTNQQCIGLQRDDMSLGARVEKTKLSIYVALVASLLISSWGCDSSSESGPGEAGAEAGANAGTEAGTDAGTEAGTDAGTEAGTDAGTEAGTDAGVETDIEEPLAPEVPIIRRVLAYINRQDGGLGLQIDGRDEDNNVTGFTLEYFFDDGEPLVVVEGGGPIALEFNELRQGNGDFVGYWTIPFLLDINVDLLRLAEARLTVFDEDENASPEKTIILLDTPTVPDGEECDLNRGLSRCGEESLCETAAGGRTTCGQAVIECPEYYNVIDLNVEGGNISRGHYRSSDLWSWNLRRRKRLTSIQLHRRCRRLLYLSSRANGCLSRLHGGPRYSYVDPKSLPLLRLGR